jgi:hypothetical protein
MRIIVYIKKCTYKTTLDTIEVEVQVFFHYYENNYGRVIQTKIVKLYKIFTYTNCVYNKNNNIWVNSKLFITFLVSKLISTY